LRQRKEMSVSWEEIFIKNCDLAFHDSRQNASGTRVIILADIVAKRLNLPHDEWTAQAARDSDCKKQTTKNCHTKRHPHLVVSK